MPPLPPDVARLLSAAPESLPLLRSALKPRPSAPHLADAATLFPGAAHAQAAVAGLLLRLGYWDRSHQVSQDIGSPEGSYWHAMVHRIEPDPANAGYWFGQVGRHPIFPDLLTRAAAVLADHRPSHWRLKRDWDPFLFTEWCGEAAGQGGELEAVAVRIQMAEWELLFDWCVTPT